MEDAVTLPLDDRQAAAAEVALIYADAREPGIRRRRARSGFYYLWADGPGSVSRRSLSASTRSSSRPPDRGSGSRRPRTAISRSPAMMCADASSTATTSAGRSAAMK